MRKVKPKLLSIKKSLFCDFQDVSLFMNVTIIILTVLLISFTILSMIRHEYWIFRVFDYPRLQKFVLSSVVLVLTLWLYSGHETQKYVLAGCLALNCLYLGWQILPFTILGRKQVLRAKASLPDQSLSIMIANVFQDNTNYSGCLKEVKKNNPDLVLLLETDQKWFRETAQLEEDYHYQVRVPLENTYGMLLYSRLELINPEVKYMVEPDIPSIHTRIKLPGGKVVQLYALHPTPPVPNENPRSTERDKELLLVAEFAKSSKDPVIVIGDLNDVAWSYTTELFLKMSTLLDPRRGRGFFNSFHAHYPFLRFPLDHAFISTEFKLKQMKRLHNFDSDHFPIYISLQYEQSAAMEQQPMEATAEDEEVAEEKKQAKT